MDRLVGTAVRWGGIIGVVNLLWLYLAYYLGLHTNGIAVFQIFIAVWLGLTVAGYFLALRAVRRCDPGLGYWRGVAAGALAAVVSAAIAVVAQVGYFKVVHPEWPEFMARQTREHFTAQGLTPEQVDERVVQARGSFTLENYAVASATTALATGTWVSAILMLFLRRRRKNTIEPSSLESGSHTGGTGPRP